MTVQENTQRVTDTLQAVKDHCMCARFEEDETHYLVVFPIGHFPGGIRVNKAIGKSIALNKILHFMEKTWKESFPGYNLK